MIGKGAYGIVCEVRCKRTGQLCAMKIQDKTKIMGSDEKALRGTLTELHVLRSSSHPYILPLIQSFQTKGHLMLVTKLCPGGDIKTLIRQCKRIDKARACLYAAEVLLALCHLHERGIMHRDLKPDNVLLDEEGHALLADFGISKEGVSGKPCAGTFCGSLSYCSPEMLRKRPYSTSVDIYGLGALLYFMLVGRSPFWAEEFGAVKAKILTEPLVVPQHVSKDAASLIEATMDRDPEKRLGSECSSEVQRHHFFGAVDWTALSRREVRVPELRLRQRLRLKMQRLKEGRAREAKMVVAAGKAKSSFDDIEAFAEDGAEVASWDFCPLE